MVFAATEGINPAPQALPNQDEPPADEPVTESLELVSRFPVKQGESGDSFEFEVTFDYQGTERKTFEFTLDIPTGWEIAINRYFSGEGEQATILAMAVEPNLQYPERIIITLKPLPGNLPEPGEHVLTFGAASGNLRDSIELKAVITELPLDYDMGFATINGRLDFPAKGGEENTIPVTITNPGSGVLTNLSFTSVKSEGWGTTFTPSRIASLESGQSVDAEVTLTPPQNTIAGNAPTGTWQPALMAARKVRSASTVRRAPSSSSTWINSSAGSSARVWTASAP